MNGRAVLARWFFAAAWRAQRGRWLLATAAVAIGVMLATAIHTVNSSALEEFQRAIDTVNGEAGVQVVGRAGMMDDAVFDTVLAHARATGVAEASPVLALDIALPARAEVAGRRERITVLGLDVFRAARVTTALLPQVDAAWPGEAGAQSPLFADDTVFLSPAAMTALGARPGGTVALPVSAGVVTLRVAGTVAAQPGQKVAVMDLGAAQWRFDALGKISRVDLMLAAGTSNAAVASALERVLPADAQVSGAPERTQRMSNLSRAYRVNLNVLALVALFTGAFLVFAAVGLAAVRARPQLALMSVLGAPAGWVRRLVLWQGAAVGLIGGIVGVAAGLALARALLGVFGGDLGGGYFAGTAPRLSFDAPALVALVALGIAVGLIAAWLPAREAVAARPAEALRGASHEAALQRLARPGPSLLFAGLALPLLFAPPIAGLPLAAYAAIALLLVAAIGAVPWLITVLGPTAQRGLKVAGARGVLAWLAFTRVAQAPGQAGGVVAGVVASFALTVAMVVMVTSFRVAVADWLDAVLPADLYVRVPGNTVGIAPATQADLASLAGVARVEFARGAELTLDPARPAVGLSARDFDPAAAQARLPLTGPVVAAPAGATPIFVSEAMVDLYGFAPGTRVRLPLGGDREFHVAGVLRDYARQHGSVAIARADYVRLTGDATVGDAALWLAPGAAPADVAVRVAALLPGAEQRSAGELRALSLNIFDRSFAMTYLLEAAALIVALFGVASGYAAQALERAREFGVLRHLGLTTREVVRLVGLEGALLSAFGALAGAGAGWVIGLVLIHRVNPQSFHWTMEARFPGALIFAGALALTLAGALAAALAARSAAGPGPLAALKEDW